MCQIALNYVMVATQSYKFDECATIFVYTYMDWR
jgi:hypothetical protein